MPDAAKTLKKKVAFFRADAGTIDWPFAIIVLILVAFGLVMVFSASYATALYRFDDSFKFIRQQAIFAFGGVIVMFFVGYKIDYHILHRFAWPLMLGALALLVIVLFMEPLNGARRWIVIPSLGTLQPSEVAKFAVIVLFAHIISINHKRMKKFSYGVLPFAVILIIIAGLMLMEPHLSGTVLIMGIGASMMFVGGTGIIWFVLAVLGAVAGVAGAVVFKPDLVPYALERIETRQNTWLDSLGSGPQTHQFRRPHRPGNRKFPAETFVSSGTAQRFYFFGDLRRTWFYRRIVGHFFVHRIAAARPLHRLYGQR